MNKLFLDSLPTSPGVYKMLDIDKNIIYIGKAGNLKKRVSSYFMRSNHSVKNQRLIEKIRDIDYQITSNEQDALLLENNLITFGIRNRQRKLILNQLEEWKNAHDLCN